MTNAQFIFNALTKQDMIYVVSFMEENKTCSLNDAINWLFEVVIVDGEDVICEREHDVSYAAHMREYRSFVASYYCLYNLYSEEDEVVSF